MNKQYNLKLDLQFRCNNQTMRFNQFDNNTSDFFIKISNGGKSFDIEKAMIVLASIKPSGKVSSQFIEVNNGVVYADLKPNMVDEIGVYTAQAMLILEDERVVTDTITYEVNESNIISAFIEDVETQEDYALLTDMLSRLSTIEISEEQRMTNEAERILAEENRKIEEAKRVEAELIRQHEEVDRAKHDATREGNENIRKLNEDLRKSNENIRLENETKRAEEENKRKLAEEERNTNYNFMVEDEERRRAEANAHKETEVLRVQAETNRASEEAKRRTTEQARVSAENTRVSNENTRETNEVVRKNNETKRVEAETQRQSRYNSFITDAEANANNFEVYTKSAKADEEDRKANELERKSQEDRRLSNEITRISSENTRKANEATRDKNEASRQNVFTSKVNEVDKKISEMENRFNNLTSKQQQDAEVIDARVDFKGAVFDSLKERIDNTDKILRDSTVSTIETESDFTTVEETSNGYFEDVKLEGKTLVNVSNLFNINQDAITDSSGYHTYTLNESYIKANFDYTLIFNSDIDCSKFFIQSYRSNGTYISNVTVNCKRGVNIFKITTDVETAGYRFRLLEPMNISNIILLEGDHTQNPPEYFEGLMSVGQDVEEVSVESTTKNVITTISNVHSVKPIYNFDIYNKQLDIIKPYLKYFTQVVDYKNCNNLYEYYYTDNNNVVWINLGTFNKEEALKVLNKRIAECEGNLNTKPLLYYNPTTETWEKPILREWDSIEKHSDGKYYYHKRSDEIKLIGSENWFADSTTKPTSEISILRFKVVLSDIGLKYAMSSSNSTQTISDKFEFLSNSSQYLKGDKEGICADKEKISLNISKSKLPTQDIQGFKQWLQANPTTVVYQLAEEEVYECTNIDLITYANETNYIVNAGAIAPKSTLKVHNNISNVVKILQEKVSLLESNVKTSQEVQDMMILESDMRILDIELALMEHMPIKLNLGESSMLRSLTYFNFLKNHIINEIYSKDYLENVMNKYLATNRLTQDEYDELYKMLYPPVYDIALPIE